MQAPEHAPLFDRTPVDLTDAIPDYVRQRIARPIQTRGDPPDSNRIEVQLYVGQRDVRFGCHVLLQMYGHRDLNVSEVLITANQGEVNG